MQKYLWGEVNVESAKSKVYCHIVGNNLCFVNEDGTNVKGFFFNNINEVILVSYEEGEYIIYDDTKHGFIKGEMFLVDKSGLILLHRSNEYFYRISNKSILLGTDTLNFCKGDGTYLSEPFLNTLYGPLKTSIVGPCGQIGIYCSSFNDEIHFVKQNDQYTIINNNMEVIRATSEYMGIHSIGPNSFKAYSNELITKELEDGVSSIMSEIKIWNSKTMKEVAIMAPYIYHNAMRFCKESEYTIIPNDKGYFSHLIVLNENDEITIDESYEEYAVLQDISTSEILIACYDPNTDYDRQIEYYDLLSLDGGLHGWSKDGRYFCTSNHHEPHAYYMYDRKFWLCGVRDAKNKTILVPYKYYSCDVYICSDGVYTIVKNAHDNFGLYYNTNQILECKYKSIEGIVDRYTETLDYREEYYHVNTGYIKFKDIEGNIGIVYKGEVLCQPQRCEIRQIEPNNVGEFYGSSEYIIISQDNLMTIFHKEKCIGTYKPCQIKAIDIYSGIWLKLIDGNFEGLIREGNSDIPLGAHKIIVYYDYKSHICVIGDKVYEKDGVTVFLGNDNEYLVDGGYMDWPYILYNTQEERYKFYRSNKEEIKYLEEDDVNLGKIAYLDKMREWVFSYEKKKIVVSPNYKSKHYEDEGQLNSDR